MFQGFSKESIEFLQQLQENNNKRWFSAHKADYENHIFSPLKELVTELGQLMLTIDPNIEITPLVNKTISRIYRDTRFTHDRSPYKTSHWITFKRPRKDWKDAPAYFFELTPDSYRYGMGFYCAMPETMAKFRQRIDKNPLEFQKVIAFYPQQNTFVLEGDQYKKLFNGTQLKAIQDWYQRKNFYLVCNREIEDRLFSKILADDLTTSFTSLSEFYRYLLQLK